MPGRTYDRDLICDLADELNRRRIPFAIQLEWPDGSYEPAILRISWRRTEAFTL
jgi:hypothetical protein